MRLLGLGQGRPQRLRCDHITTFQLRGEENRRNEKCDEKCVCVFAARKEGKMGKVNERKVAQSITSQHWLVVACCVAARSCLWPLADVMNILLEWPMKQIVKVVTKGS